MNPIATAIKTIVEGQELTYLRSVNINDLNEQVGNTNLSAGAGVYSSLPEIENLRNAGGSVTANTTIEVYYLKPNAEVDDRGEAIDVILDELRPFADGFFDQIKKEAFMSLSADIEGYELDAIETLKLTKEVLTGWRVRMVLPIDRAVYYCSIPSPFDPDAQAVIDQMVNPTETQQNAINDFVVASKAAGNWQLMDDFACGSLGDVTASNGLLKWKSLAQMVAFGGTTIDLNGWNLNGTNAYVDSGFKLVTNGVQYTQLSGALTAFIKTISNTGEGWVCASFDGTSPPHSKLKMSTSQLGGRINQAGNSSGDLLISHVAESNILLSLSRTSNILTTLYKDGISEATQANVSGVPVDTDLYLGAGNLNGVAINFIQGVVSSITISAGVGFDHAAHNTNVRNLLTSLGVTL